MDIKDKLKGMPERMNIAQPDPGLRIVRYNYYGLKNAPPEFGYDTPAGVVFYHLNICYRNQRNVSEGVVEDVIWGFRQSGIPNALTYDGFKALKKHGYMAFTDKNRVVVFADDIHKLWYNWTQKFYKLLLDREIPENERPIDVLTIPKGINYMDIK